MAEFFRISHDVDRLDLAVLDFKRGGLWNPVILGCHETRQTIDQAFMQNWRQSVRRAAGNTSPKNRQTFSIM